MDEEKILQGQRALGIVSLIAVLLLITALTSFFRVNGGVVSEAAGPAKGSCWNLSLGTSPSVTSPGGMVGIFAMAQNCSNKPDRTKVTFTETSPCGNTKILGYNRLSLYAGETIQVTVSDPIAPDACLGQYIETITASSGQSAASILTVQ